MEKELKEKILTLNIKDIEAISPCTRYNTVLPIIMYSLKGKPLQIFYNWSGVRDHIRACKKSNGLMYGLKGISVPIGRCANSKKSNKSAYGYQWRSLIDVNPWSPTKNFKGDK